MLFLQKLQLAINKCDLVDVAIEKTELTEKKTVGFFGIGLFKNRKIFASVRSILAPDKNQ
jgi:hypothetical protein